MNQLQYETSPYLLQHKNNPVNWYAWNDVALEKAQKEQKMILVSVGYSACHWCHVMEHESFEDEEVAKVMNQYFVAIKVDRQERPDIDQIYMNAAQMTSGQGGWPLNVVCLPDGKPIYGATYFPKERWLQFLHHFQNLFETDKEKMLAQAERLQKGIQLVDTVHFNTDVREIDERFYHQIWKNWKDKLDYEEGGTLGMPKFAMPIALEFLLRYQSRTKDEKLSAYLKTTLKKMAFGGIHDIVAGGFARYSVDAYWKVPHFEKMLYDNAQLLTVYAQAYQITKRPMYKSVCYKILDWINEEMTDKSGGIYAALDADSEGVEGKFYCWNYDEFIQIMAHINHQNCKHIDIKNFGIELYNITKEGNFEHGMNILFRTKEHEYFCEKYQLEQKVFHELVDEINARLAKAREHKIRPHLDDKILTEWNALAIIGLMNAYKAFGDQLFLNKAISIANFIIDKVLQSDNRLYRSFKNDKVSINGFLADYVFFIECLILLFQSTFDEQYLKIAQQLTAYCIQHFYSAEHKMFYITSNLDTALVVRSMDSSDNVIPAANSQMAKCLLYLSKYLDNHEYEHIAVAMLNNVLDSVVKNGQYYANWAIVLDMYLYQNIELVIVGKNAHVVLQKLNGKYLPDILIAGSKIPSFLTLLKDRFVEDKTLMYWCENKACNRPVENMEALNLF